MRNPIQEDLEEPPPSPTGSFDLGNWLGRWQAFSFVAGRCAAADLECLRQIRDKKLFRDRSRTWSQFCARYLGLGRAQADRLLQNLEEFGPGYFRLTRIVPVSAQSYRAISHAVRDGNIVFMDVPIELVPENAGRIRRAVRELRRHSGGRARELPPGESASWAHPRGSDPPRDRILRLVSSLDRTVRAFEALATAATLDPADENTLAAAASRAVQRLSALQRTLRR